MDLARGREMAVRLDPRVVEYAVVSPRRLRELVNARKGAAPVTIVACTEGLRWKPGVDHPVGVRKIARVQAMLNAVYERSVNRRRAKEGKAADFQAGPRSWGTKLQGPPLVVHVSKPGDVHLYFDAQVTKVLGVEYRGPEGGLLDRRRVEEMLQPRRRSRQGLEREVQIRNYRLDHVLTVVMDGQGYLQDTGRGG